MPSDESAHLKRTLGFWALLAYGVGDMLGAGIYALVGKVAGYAGHLAWVSFALAMLAATLTACVYAELASRYPRSGGAAYYCDRAFRRPELSIFIGWLVLCSGLVSMATASRAFAGYLTELVPALPFTVGVCCFLLLIGAIAFRGIRESSTSNIVCTSIELTGLLIVIVTGLSFIFGSGAPQPGPAVTAEAAEATAWLPVLILQGAGPAFFACIGFEDVANVAEEVKSPEKTIPRALLGAMAIVGIVYMLVAYIATSAVPPHVISESKAPLVAVIEKTAPWAPLKLFSAIAMFAVANTSLLNCVMASRLIYGMARENLLPEWTGRVHPTRQTPYIATLMVISVALVLAVTGTVAPLAGTTSLLLLTVFIVVSCALLVVRRREPGYTGFRVPWPVPAGSILICAVLIVYSQYTSMAIALGIGIVGAVIALLRGSALAAPQAH